MEGERLPDALAESGTEGVWWQRLRRCTAAKRPVPEAKAAAMLGCASAFSQFVVTTGFDERGDATATISHHRLDGLADCLGIEKGQIKFALVPQRGPIPAALKTTDSQIANQPAIVPGAAYSVYVGREPALLYAATVVIAPGQTALQRLLGRRTGPWLDASWSSGELRFRVNQAGVNADAFAEIVLAAEQHNMWFEAFGRQWDVVPLDATHELQLSSALYQALKEQRWGSLASRIAPTDGEWRELLGHVSLCLPRSYRRSEGTTCAPLLDVARMPPPPRVQIVVGTAARDVKSRRVFESSSHFVRGASAIIGRWDSVRIISSTGGATEAHQWCQRGCTPTFDPSARGLLEYRLGHRHDAQGLTLARVWVLDPTIDWRPADAFGGTWPRHEFDRDGYAYRPQRSFAFTSVVVPEEVERIWQVAGTPIPKRLPFISGDRTKQSLFSVVSSSETCPRTAERTIPSVIDQHFYVYLLTADETGTRCLARAPYRVWDARSRGTASSMRAVFFGDPLLAVSAEERAVALYLPIWSVFSPRVANGRFDLSVGVAGIRQVQEDVTVGASTWSGVQFGPSRSPRLFVAGVSFTLTLAGEQVVASYLGLNLGTLYDVAGGR